MPLCIVRERNMMDGTCTARLHRCIVYIHATTTFTGSKPSRYYFFRSAFKVLLCDDVHTYVLICVGHKACSVPCVVLCLWESLRPQDCKLLSVYARCLT